LPELPEAERARALIEQRALGRRIAEVDDRDTYVCRPHAPGEMAQVLRGRELTSAHRRGKSMWCETDGGPVLFLHLGMAGKLVVDEEAHLAWDRFVLEFEDGGRLALRDKRRLGRAVLDPDLERLGPDAGEVSRRDFVARVGGSAAPIKARLMDQAVVAGLGNLLVDETLWRARLSPTRPAGDLSDDELADLHRHVRAAIRDAIRGGGAHVGKLGEERRRGGSCPRCGTELAVGRVGGRTTFWCPVDQGAGQGIPAP
jgi:formamidopyrimidine-DNA glycosylase